MVLDPIIEARRLGSVVLPFARVAFHWCVGSRYTWQFGIWVPDFQTRYHGCSFWSFRHSLSSYLIWSAHGWRGVIYRLLDCVSQLELRVMDLLDPLPFEESSYQLSLFVQPHYSREVVCF